MLGQFSYANLELVKAEGFARELRLDPRRLDDAAIESIRQRVRKRGFCFVARTGRKSYRPRPGQARNAESVRYEDDSSLRASLGLPIPGGLPGTIKGAPLAQQLDEIFRGYTGKYFPLWVNLTEGGRLGRSGTSRSLDAVSSVWREGSPISGLPGRALKQISGPFGRLFRFFRFRLFRCVEEVSL